jgi:hypothetical protein
VFIATLHSNGRGTGRKCRISIVACMYVAEALPGNTLTKSGMNSFSFQFISFLCSSGFIEFCFCHLSFCFIPHFAQVQKEQLDAICGPHIVLPH